MKSMIISLVTYFILMSSAFGQTQNSIQNRNYFQISPRAGYDLPTYHNNTPYIDYKGGMELGVSADYYWNWFGLGADFDYIKNQPVSTYPTTNLVDASNLPITSFNLVENKIVRTFYGIGPGFKYQTNSGRFTAELTGRVGLAAIKGGRTELWETTTLTGQLLNFHAGYQANNILSLKGQGKVSYFFNQYLGLHVGAYYLRHLGAQEAFDNSLGMSAGYQPVSIDGDASGKDVNKYSGAPVQRSEPCFCDISSVGVFAGVSLKIPLAGKKSKNISDKCNACDNFSLAVTARDKFTKELLPNTDVLLKDLAGNVVKTGSTNSFGVVVFDNCQPENYSIEGALYAVNLDGNSIAKSEFIPNKTIQKEILYSDLNFILKGKAVVCNTTEPLDNVSVILRNQSVAEQRNTVTNNKGAFLFHLKQQSEYLIHGKKANYFSQVEAVSTKDFNRSTTLFVKLEICMEEADCGKSIALKNIYYDLDKYFLRAAAKKELDKLVQFLTDYPEVKIELYSHTDSRGSNSYNQKLSQNRANSAVDYVVSQGIARHRIMGIGYGESKLLNGCSDGVNCSETEHQKNRRTEMKVICPR